MRIFLLVISTIACAITTRSAVGNYTFASSAGTYTSISGTALFSGTRDDDYSSLLISSASYQWKKNGVDVGSNSTFHTDASLANGDHITCTISSVAACVSPSSAVSNTITKTIDALPSGLVITPAGPISVCPGVTTVLSVQSPESGVIYTWSDGGTGTTHEVIDLNTSIYCTSSNSAISNTVVINLGSLPSAVTVSGSGPSCSSMTLSASGGNPGTIYWQGTTSNGTSQSTPSINQTVSTSGTYYFRANNSCGWGAQGSATVTINTPPNNWTGAVSSAWENPGNWRCGAVADSITDVLISSGTVIVNSNAVCRKLTVLPGVNFIVNTGFSLFCSSTADPGINFSGKTVVFIGNSITRGIYTTDSTHRWTYLFCAAKGATEANMGISGQTMQVNPTCGGTSCFNRTTIPAYNPAIHAALFISLGINDVGLNNGLYSPSGFKTDYTAALTYAINTKGWPANRIILLNVYQPYSWNVYTYIEGCTVSVPANAARAILYNTKIAEVANENGCRLIDIYSAMGGLTSNYFYVDGLHPVDLGHAFIANYIISQFP